MATPALSLRELPSALEPLTFMDGAAKDNADAVGSLCRMLRLGAHALIRTADPRTGRPDPGQFAYVAGLHGQPELRGQAEQLGVSRPVLWLRWTTALLSSALRQRLRGHKDRVSGCVISGDGRLGLSASWDKTLIVWDLESGKARQRLRGHEDGVRMG